MDRDQRIEKANWVIQILEREYPDAKITLNFSNPLELVIATILAAQCTDERVNHVTKDLFKKYRDVRDYVNAPLEELEEDIRPTGYYRNKARSIKRCCEELISRFQGNVPDKMEDLISIPGIGRKTANMVLGSAFGKPGIVVDTHVQRVSKRLGLTDQIDPVKIEFDLMTIVPERQWVSFSHQLIAHGRMKCKAKNPRCNECPLSPHCDYVKRI
jgi:endonuclease-3